MNTMFYPGILYPPDEDGLSGCFVPDLKIAASGASPDDALRDAALILAELLASMVEDDDAFPAPTPAQDIDLDGGTLAMIGAPFVRAKRPAAA
ncbi:MAG: hypothetical protein ACFB2Z_04630 [Maricaulaceae bacterium]